MFTGFSLNCKNALFRQKWKFLSAEKFSQGNWISARTKSAIPIRRLSQQPAQPVKEPTPERTCAENMRDLLVRQLTESEHTGAKVTVVGSGRAGMAVAFSLFRQGVVTRLAMVADNEDVLQGEMMDIMHGSIFLDNRQMVAQRDYSITKGSSVCVIAAGHPREATQSRQSVFHKNLAILKKIIPEIVRLSPNVIFIIVTNPVDLLSYATWRLSGLPSERVIGVGTMMDCVRFQFYLSQRLKVDPLAVRNAWILGVHGEKEFNVPIWSTIHVYTVPLEDIDPTAGTEEDPNGWNTAYDLAVGSGSALLKLKGHSSWCVGLCVSSMIRSLLVTCNTVMPVSINVKGFLGINEDVYMSLPCMLCRNGVWNVINLPLTKEQLQKLHKTADHMLGLSRTLQW